MKGRQKENEKKVKSFKETIQEKKKNLREQLNL